MLFNSYAFIFVFLPVAFAVTFWLGRYNSRWAAAWLALASLAFYAMWDVRFVPLLLGSVIGNFAAGYWIVQKRAARPGQSRGILIAAIAANLLLLGCFKYANFFVATANAAFDGRIPALDVILPLGISFFTFTQIAFLVDASRGRAREYSFTNYLLFVTYFPHLIAGPVLHHEQMMPQFARPEIFRLDQRNISAGLTIFILGLAKKVLIADNIAIYATPVFDAARDGSVIMLVEAWTGALAYTLQLYFDFSGYSDMAIGLSLLFNVRMPLNFDSPYKATSIIDFWRRWHMTLSAFLRDYLYVPLGGNRRGPARRYLNLLVTMLLGGLWHGAGWTFVVWGGLHGVYLLVNHAWRELKARLGWRQSGGFFAVLGGGALTFLAVVVGWVFFRADSLATAGSILAGMAGFNGLSLPPQLEGSIGPLAARLPGLAVAFDGALPASNGAITGAAMSIFCGLAIVWLGPNARQMLRGYQSNWEDWAGKATAPSTPPSPAWLRWEPRSRFAVPAGLLLFLCLLYMVSQRVSEFLYFQF